MRDRLLSEFLGRPAVKAHVREAARRVGASAPAVAEELSRLATAGILSTERIGRSLVYSVNERSPIVPELRSLVRKTIGVEGQLRSALEGLPGVEAAYVFGSRASGRETPQSDVDLLVVGAPDRAALAERLAQVEEAIGRDINLVQVTGDDLERHRTGPSPFWKSVLAGPLHPLVEPPA